MVLQWFWGSSEVRRAFLLGGTARTGPAVGQGGEREREKRVKAQLCKQIASPTCQHSSRKKASKEEGSLE